MSYKFEAPNTIVDPWRGPSLSRGKSALLVYSTCHILWGSGVRWSKLTTSEPPRPIPAKLATCSWLPAALTTASLGSPVSAMSDKEFGHRLKVRPPKRICLGDLLYPQNWLWSALLASALTKNLFSPLFAIATRITSLEVIQKIGLVCDCAILSCLQAIWWLCAVLWTIAWGQKALKRSHGWVQRLWFIFPSLSSTILNTSECS